MKFKFSVGEKVLCFEPDVTKARVLYNAKIMDADITKDIKGKKYIEYKIHFQGWNHAWDRWADESFVMRDDEQNRRLQKKLAKRAFKQIKLQKGRRSHLPGVANKQEGNNLVELESSSGESTDSDMTASARTKRKLSESDDFSIFDKNCPSSSTGRPGFSEAPSEDVSFSRDEYHLRKLMSLDIPASLQRRLEEDNVMIKRRNMLVSLPIRPNVVQILENYVKKFAIKFVGATEKQKFVMTATGQPVGADYPLAPDKRLNLCQEVCCDLKLLFDYTLPLVLLYLPERAQYKHVTLNTKLSETKSFHLKNKLFSTEIKDNTAMAGSEVRDTISIESHAIGERSKQMESAMSSDATHLLTPMRNQRSLSESSDTHLNQDQPKPKKKNAEARLIEETHRYLIPNLDQTGLSKDSFGRRRSSRLSHHDSGSPQKPSMLDMPVVSSEEKMGTSDFKMVCEEPKYSVTIGPCIFLRAPRLVSHSTNSANGEGSSCSSAILRQPLYNADPCMDRESYLSASGSDIKNIVELRKVWDWCIVPDAYEPEDGATIPPSLIYGIHHLLRLFVKLPDILMKMEIPEFKLKVLTKHLNSLLKFLADYERELFEVDAYVPSNTIEMRHD